MEMFNPAHPGEVLREAYLDPLNMSITEFARRIDISRKYASEFINKRYGVSVKMAYRLAKATNTSAESWLCMQMNYDLWQAKKAKLPQKLHIEKLAT